MDESGHGTLAIATGLVAVGSVVCLGIFFASGGPFGPINDIGNATTGVLSGVLAWRMRRQVAGTDRGTCRRGGGDRRGGHGPRLEPCRVGHDGLDARGFVSSLGFAGIGAWLIVLNRSVDQVAVWPSGCAGSASSRER